MSKFSKYLVSLFVRKHSPSEIHEMYDYAIDQLNSGHDTSGLRDRFQALDYIVNMWSEKQSA
jgi:hypothetical protein